MSNPASRNAFEVGDRRLRAGQDHEIGVAGQRTPNPHADQLDSGLGLQRVEVVEVCDVRQDWNGDADARTGLGCRA